MIERKYLLDVSRQIHKGWVRELPTGIDRVCNAYLQHFKDQAHAVVHFKGFMRVFDAKRSKDLFSILLDGNQDFRSRLSRLLPRALATSWVNHDCKGAFYLNVAQTDFQHPRLSQWTRHNRLRPIYLIHDLIPLSHPEFCRPIAVLKHRERITTALKGGAGIIVNSLATARDLERFAAHQSLPMPPMKAAWISGELLRRKNAAPPLGGQRYFVVLGTIEGRKNHFMLLQVWRRLVESMGDLAPRLVIIGQHGTEAEHVAGMLDRCRALRSHVKVLSHCEDNELGHWVANSQALLMPSFAEGFGLPVVEALRAGTPVIASDLPCFREIGCGIPTLLDPLDAPNWQRMIVSFMQNGPERQRQLHALKSFRAPTWREHFSQIMAWLDMLPRSVRLPRQPVSGEPELVPALTSLYANREPSYDPLDA